VIILSVGYGRTKEGRVYTNFGPVNKPGGERRLNVAVTRAKDKLIVVSSIRAGDMKASSNPGVRTLRRYLDYAERGIAALGENALAVGAGANARPIFESPFEQAVYTALSAKGLKLDTQVGCSGYRIDLAVRDPQSPDRYLLGIECDGASYHSAKTARDRDRLRQQCLEGLGWRIHRIWSSDWFQNPSNEVTRVLALVQQMIASRQTSPSAAS
jgi:very-short-patch-repair endonuclease